MFNKLKQIKDLRDKAKSLQAELGKEQEEGSAAWGKIKITMDGNQQIIKVDIDPELLTPENKEKVENGIKEAFADALKKIQKTMMSKMKDIGGLDFPGLG